MLPKNAVNWFEIPTLDLARAQRFYEIIFSMEMIPMDFPNLQMRMFPTTEVTGIGGALVFAPEYYEPSDKGTMVYLNGNPNLQTILDKVEAAGGKILMPKTAIAPDIGSMAMFLDTEGNRVALHNSPES